MKSKSGDAILASIQETVESIIDHNKLEELPGDINAVSRIFDRLDPYTIAHQRHVAELARAIANVVGLSEWQGEMIYVSGLLHDIGKVVVPARILDKPQKLTQNELNLIKTHPQVGCRILVKLGFTWQVTQAILQHHERLNGTGYPAGLSGRDIILEAKIVAVADVIEAMLSPRPYRAALDLSYVLKEISQRRGILYDSEVVDAGLKLFNTSGFMLENEKLTSTMERHEYINNMGGIWPAGLKS
jgi:putative nucleotidyltransferase with HDIG domain